LQAATRNARLQHQRLKAEAGRQRQITRMQQFLTSGDPILVAEALAWVQVNPGVLDTSQLPLDLLIRLPPEATLVDRSSLGIAIETHLQRLAWSEPQVCHYLQQQLARLV